MAFGRNSRRNGGIYGMNGMNGGCQGYPIYQFPTAGIYGLRFWKVMLISIFGGVAAAAVVFFHPYIVAMVQEGKISTEAARLGNVLAADSLASWLRTVFYLVSALTAWGLSGYRFPTGEATARNVMDADRDGGFEREAVWAWVTTYCLLLSIGNATCAHYFVPRLMKRLTDTTIVPGIEASWWLVPAVLVGALLGLKVFSTILSSGLSVLFLLISFVAGVLYCLPYFGYSLASLPIPIPESVTGIETIAVPMIGPWALMTALLLHASWTVNSGDRIYVCPTRRP